MVWVTRSVAAIALSAIVYGLLLWIYIPGINGPSLLDDFSSLSGLEHVKESPVLAWDYIVGDKSGPFGRPVAMATFVLDNFLFENTVSGAKFFNIVLHIFAGLLTTCLFWLLLRRVHPKAALLAAFIGGAYWSLSPIFVSTVLYAVQRMAILACMFMVLSMILYIVWRGRYFSGEKAWPVFLLLLAALFLAVMSKENGLLVVPIVLLMEWLWFGFRDDDGDTDRNLRATVAALIGLGGLAVLVLAVRVGVNSEVMFASREFGLLERLLTQSRVLWDYIGQLFWPDTSRMGIYFDDIVISTSLASPPSTLPAVLGLFAVLLACAALIVWDRGKKIAFCILFFFIGHAFESTVFPLELYFEHRNYFPALGFALLIGLLYAELLKRWPVYSRVLQAYAVVGLVFLSLKTSAQVQVWSSSTLLRMNHYIGHPDSFRANVDMAVVFAHSGSLSRALEYSRHAHSVGIEGPGDYYFRDNALACVVGQRLPTVPSEYGELLGSPRPISSVVTVNAYVSSLQDGLCDESGAVALSEIMAELLLAPDTTATAAPNTYAALAAMENALENFSRALRYTELFLSGDPNNTRGQLMKLHFATALGKVEVAEEMIAVLQAKQAAGELNVGEQQTLALYTEQP